MGNSKIIPTVKLKEVCLKIGSGATPKGGDKMYSDFGEYSFVRSQNIYNDRFEKSGIVFIDSIQAKILKNVELQKNDILLNITGDSVARCCIAPDYILPGRVNQHVAIIRTNQNILRPKYLNYYLTSPDMQRFMLKQASAGATRNALTKNMIEDFIVPCPSLKEQDAIIEIISPFDDKIVLNREMNETLEGMARALFKSWFVDFEPVKAKAAGLETGLPQEIDALFPDGFEDSELGPIPKGWKVYKLGDLIDVKHGYSFKSEYFSKNETPYILLTPGNFKIGGGFKSEKFKYYDGPVPETFILSENDLLITMTDLSKNGDTLGYPALIPKDSSLIFLHNQRLGRVFIKNNMINKEFVFEFLKTETYRQYIVNSATGSTVKHTSPSIIKETKFVLPIIPILLKFQEITSYIYKKIQYDDMEAKILSSIRDLLLPRLISGEIRVDTKGEAKKVAKSK